MKLHNHSNEQRTVLMHQLEETGRELLAINFDKPELDNLYIRRHAYLKGRFETLAKLLEDTYPEPEALQPENED